MPIRVAQERQLFGFFAASCSVFEAAFYSINAAAVIVEGDIGGSDPGRQREVTPISTTKRLNRGFSTTPIARELRDLITLDDYKHLVRIRNVVSHRTSPPRLIFASSSGIDLERPASWELSIHGYESEPLTSETTAVRRAWVSVRLEALCKAFAEFLDGVAVLPGASSH
jgi:hypothetical protein